MLPAVHFDPLSLHKIISNYFRNSSGTSSACALVTGAAALVLEKYPHFTPAQVKRYLIDEATDGAIDMSIIIRGDRINKLLYVGNGT